MIIVKPAQNLQKFVEVVTQDITYMLVLVFNLSLNKNIFFKR